MSSFFSKSGTGTPDIEVQVADRQPKQYYLNTGAGSGSTSLPPPAPPGYAPHVSSPFDVGIFKDTLLPSLGLHGSLAVLGYGVARATDRVEVKDFLWPTGQVLNAWWSAVGRRVWDGMPLTSALNRLSWPERLVLTGVTLWGGRLLYRISSRSSRRGKDDPRYEDYKNDEGFWNKSLFTVFLPDALFQTVISLPFTAPFRHHGAASMTGYHPWIQMGAVGLFSTGFALETLADVQLDAHKADGNPGLMKDGVWSIVRHPNYLGDFLSTLSFPLLLYGSDLLAPISLLSPLANYVYMRYYSGDREQEAVRTRRYSVSDPEKMADLEKMRSEKNSFWPKVEEIGNKWTGIVIGCGIAGILIEEGLRSALH